MTDQSTNQPANRWWAVLSTLFMPLLLGLACYFVLVGAIERRLLDDEWLVRYITGHPVSKVTTAMFLIGIAALILIAADILDQLSSLKKISLRQARRKNTQRSKPGKAAPDTSGPSLSIRPPSTEDPEEALASQLDEFDARLFGLPRRTQKSYLWNRLRMALSFIRQNGDASGLDDELRYLSEQDQEKKHDRYALVRILIWATPMLGFLGTVLGISEALGGIAVGPENDFQAMMNSLQGSLYIAFDTTALALTFSILLMFCQFIADRFESQLLSCVDQTARQELDRRFDVSFDRQDEYIKAIKKMSEQLLQANSKLVKQQCDLWNQSIHAAQEAWIDSLEAPREQILKHLTTALQQSTSQLADQVDTTIDKVDATLERRISQWQTMLSKLMHDFSQQQHDSSDQLRSFQGTLQELQQLHTMQRDLTNCLGALPDSTLIQDTTDKLATAIRLLEFRLNQAEPQSPRLRVAMPEYESTADKSVTDDSPSPNTDPGSEPKRRAA